MAFLLCIPKKMQELQKQHYQASVDKTQRRMDKGYERPDIMSYIMRNNGKNGMTIPEIESSMNVLSVGGSHNSASTMSGITNYLVRNPTCLQRLTQEVRSAHKSSNELTFSSLLKLPYLNAVIEEGLRIAPPFPAGLPRCVPSGGDTVCGEWLPGGVSDPSNLQQVLSLLISFMYRHKYKSILGRFNIHLPHLHCQRNFIRSVGFLSRISLCRS